MKTVDILFINLPTNNWYKDKIAKSNSMPPLGLLYVASYVKENGYSVKIIDFAVETMTHEKFIDVLKNYEPKIVGLSTYNETWNAQKVICKTIKNVLPKSYIFAGGAFATFCYEDMLRESCTDYVIRGEGEIATLELIKFLLKEKQTDKINYKGIVYKDSMNNIVDNGIADRIKNLDNLGVPDRELIDLSNYIMPYTISTARGCPGDCIFCSSKSFWGKKVYMRSAESVFAEVMYLYDRFGTLVFYITDDTFTASYKRAIKFCELIMESGIKFVWGCESRADVINEDLIRIMSDSGCKKLQIGLESADNEILSKIKKNVTIEEIENGIKLANKYNLHITASYIIGHAFDTHETINKTLTFAKRIQKDYGAHVVGSVNTPFPGTEQYEKRDELGIKIYESDWNQFILNSPIISTNHITREELRKYHNNITNVMSNNRN
ncbi:radical SAM protein [Clostridiaceae bacterium M8S5]|nr:radical SAM protein [Clostridiaceae bacterium M8S5]